MNVSTYVGKLSGKTHLEVKGITLATEGDVCRDETLRSMGCDVWTVELLRWAADEINAK